MSARLMALNTASERMTTAVTRPPAWATLRISTPSPSAAIEMIVSPGGGAGDGGKRGGGDQAA